MPLVPVVSCRYPGGQFVKMVQCHYETQPNQCAEAVVWPVGLPGWSCYCGRLVAEFHLYSNGRRV